VCNLLQPVNIVAGAFFIVGAAILAGAVDVAMLVVGHILLGVGVGLCSLVSFCPDIVQVSLSVQMRAAKCSLCSILQMINAQFWVALWSANNVGLIKRSLWAT